MKQTLNYLIFIIIILTSCKSQKEVKVNTKGNNKYRKSIKSFRGTLTRDEYANFIFNLELELKTKLPEDKSVLINYSQRGDNCILLSVDKESFITINQNVIRISNRISDEYHAVDFFVYSENSFFKDFYSRDKKYQLDSGFFYNVVFTLHENCQGFFILKPNGDFLKHYGRDYFTIVKNFLSEK
jgi:hypothetical protein